MDASYSEEVKLTKRQQYERDIDTFKGSVKNLYTCGANTFLSTTRKGDRETIFFHALRCYLPTLATETYNNHGVGLGVFSMQGFERRNKESKNTLRRFNNNKGNTLLQNLRRIWDVFWHGKNAM